MTDEHDDIALYVRRLAAHLRNLPLRDAVPFLHGALVIAGENAAVKELRGTYRDLSSAADQLDQIADLHAREEGGPEL